MQPLSTVPHNNLQIGCSRPRENLGRRDVGEISKPSTKSNRRGRRGGPKHDTSLAFGGFKVAVDHMGSDVANSSYDEMKSCPPTPSSQYVTPHAPLDLAIGEDHRSIWNPEAVPVVAPEAQSPEAKTGSPETDVGVMEIKAVESVLTKGANDMLSGSRALDLFIVFARRLEDAEAHLKALSEELEKSCTATPASETLTGLKREIDSSSKALAALDWKVASGLGSQAASIDEFKVALQAVENKIEALPKTQLPGNDLAKALNKHNSAVRDLKAVLAGLEYKVKLLYESQAAQNDKAVIAVDFVKNEADDSFKSQAALIANLASTLETLKNDVKLLAKPQTAAAGNRIGSFSAILGVSVGALVVGQSHRVWEYLFGFN